MALLWRAVFTQAATGGIASDKRRATDPKPRGLSLHQAGFSEPGTLRLI
jgi:hypothetical protein